MRELRIKDRSAGLPPVSRVAVPAVSFAQHPGLVARLEKGYPGAKVNVEGDIYYRSEEETIAYLRGHDAAIVSFEKINDRVLSALPDLRVVSKLGVGLDQIDPLAMRKHGVRLGWTPGVNKRAVAELALCTAMAALRHVMECNLSMRNGERPLTRLGRQLSGRVVGVHGVGEIGQEFIRLLQPFGCRVLGCDNKDRSDFYVHHGVEQVDMEELAARSEVLSIHLGLNPTTRNLYDLGRLRSLRPDCVLINTARGGIIDERALHRALSEGWIAAAALDVFAEEPTSEDDLLRLPNLISTPHIGASSVEARWHMGVTAIDGLTDNFIPVPGRYPFEFF
ncbi:D-3-phosphoglycerate dehydrogenase [Pseudorhizobium tarimense]|uniref:D-3-phosphoglycerate dehydrogenase n=1 Tax=Pseudorhizobium tarimense TaxID=1079109 RepID=A0ABV2HBH2_9HYPH|nr:NAD(P)-dependent oxidoreductase [Pseudorhizobium tarimense]MCJ8520943.1 3-phosphoglycerate dehydrogenase [Pseudorhizobium tarimense]